MIAMRIFLRSFNWKKIPVLVSADSVSDDKSRLSMHKKAQTTPSAPLHDAEDSDYVRESASGEDNLSESQVIFPVIICTSVIK